MSNEKPKFKKNNALRFYYEVLGLERLHYGLWEESDPRTLEGVKVAQKRYEDFLVAEIEELSGEPSKTKILDVGCGSGIMSETLFKRNFPVEGLSPDLFQKEIFEKRIPVKFHLERFQYFEPEHKYNVVLMSESAQYIPLSRLFKKAEECMEADAFLVVCDYFVYDDATGPMAKSGHKLTSFLKQAEADGFKIVKQRDITGETIPTLDVARIFVEKYIIPTVDIFSEKFQEKKPRLLKFLKWVFRKHLNKVHDNLVLINSSEFAKSKCYMYFLLVKNT